MKNELFVENNREKEPGFKDLVIFTSTLHNYDNEVNTARAKLVEKFLKNAEDLNVTCVVMDAGSDASFIEKLHHFKNVELLESSGLSMGEQRRKALEKALSYPDAKYFLWTEPEKDDLIKKNSLTDLIEELRENKTDIAVAARNSKESYPEFQQWTETRMNKRMDDLLPDKDNLSLDWAFAPKMFNRDGAQFFINYEGKLDKWDAIIKPVLDAAKAGKRVSSVNVDYTYDTSQRDAEENNREMKKKRVDQYIQLLKEMGDAFWSNKDKELGDSKK